MIGITDAARFMENIAFELAQQLPKIHPVRDSHAVSRQIGHPAAFDILRRVSVQRTIVDNRLEALEFVALTPGVRGTLL